MKQEILIAEKYKRIPAGELKLFIITFVLSYAYYITVNFSSVGKGWFILLVGFIYIIGVIVQDSLLWPIKWIVKFIHNNIFGYYYCITAIGKNYKINFIKTGQVYFGRQLFHKTNFIKIYLPIGGWFAKPIIFFQPRDVVVYEPSITISRLSFQHNDFKCFLKDCDGSEICCTSTMDIFSLLMGLYYSGQITWKGYFIHLNPKDKIDAKV